MPIPEDLLVYGRTDLLVPIAHAQPDAGAVPAFAANPRAVTRGVVFHYAHGWWYRGWRLAGGSWLGTAFNIDLDGALFQCQEMGTRTLHVGGGPLFTGGFSFVNDTAVGVEVCRFGAFVAQGGEYRASGYAIRFVPAAEPASGECDYSPGFHPAGGTLRFSLRKMRGGILVNTPHDSNRHWYYAKLHAFGARRNVKTGAPFDALYTEEQMATMILWGKAMCEMNRLPKRFFANPDSGEEDPWIADTALAGPAGGANQARHLENRRRARAHLGIFGHVSVQANRFDPGPAFDYYRLRRGMSDEWWTPADPSGAPRPLDYLDAAREGDYVRMPGYGGEAARMALMGRIEAGGAGFYPFGENRVWHGGVHVDGAGPIHAMANGVVVCARVTNGTYAHSRAPEGVTASRCFVLVRHEVHVLDEEGVASDYWSGTRRLIDYRQGATRTLYTLYMHLEPYIDRPAGAPEVPGARGIARDAQGRYALDWERLPWWLNRWLVDHPDEPSVLNGGLIFPNERVELGDVLGWAGTYITGKGSAGQPVFGPVCHVELFTTVDPSTFPGSPWTDAANRIEDPNADLLCDPGLVDGLILDRGGDGLDGRDIRDVLPTLRDIAVRHRSEWSLTAASQLGKRLVSWWGYEQRPLGEVVTAAQWASDIAPLMFHADMAAGGDADAIGPFHGETKVWHLHPLTFLRWMTDRVQRHEALLAVQNRSASPALETLAIDGEYVVGWLNQGGPGGTTLSWNAGGVYPPARYGENAFEVGVDVVADRAALRAAPQTRTLLHVRLLDVIDQVNDRLVGLDVARSWEGGPVTGPLVAHAEGRALLLRPQQHDAIGRWFNLRRFLRAALDFVNARHPDVLLRARWTDADAGEPAATVALGAELDRRFAGVADAGNPALTAPPAPGAEALAALRLQVLLVTASRRLRVRFTQVQVIDDGAYLPGASWTLAFRVRGAMVGFVDRQPVSSGSTFVIPAGRATTTIEVEGAATTLGVEVEGSGHGPFDEWPLPTALRFVDLAAVGASPLVMVAEPANASYRVFFEIVEA